jgi:CheY-like chemotaxis protein
MKVLVVDDDRDTIELMKAVGGHAGVEMIAFTTGLDALKYLEDHEVDVAVLDLEMPVLDGLRLAKEIRKNEELHPGKRPVQLVFATGHEIGDTIERVGDRVGVQRRYMIHKPFDVCGLMNELKKDFEYSS